MHIHIPDGVLPIWLWVAGYLMTAIFLAIVLPKLKKEEKKFPLVGMASAIVLLITSIPLGLPVHLNLMVLIGLIVGPSWSLVVSFIVNLILASFGHGGLTIVGLNTIVFWTQALLGILLFKILSKLIKNYFASAGLATFISLLFSFLLIVGIVFISTVDPGEFLHREGEMGHLEISLRTFIILSSPLALLGSLIESIIIGFGVQYIKKVKSELLA